MVLKIYHNLYVSDVLKDQKDEIINKIKKRTALRGKYVIVLTEQEHNHLECFNASLMLQKGWVQRELFLVGLADGYRDAIVMLKEIVQDVYAKTGGVEIRSYLLEQQRAFEEKQVG